MHKNVRLSNAYHVIGHPDISAGDSVQTAFPAGIRGVWVEIDLYPRWRRQGFTHV